MDEQKLIAWIKLTEGNLKTLIEDGRQSAKEVLRLSLEVHALRMAVADLGAELAEQDGVSGELFRSRFERLANWHLDQMYLRVGDERPDLPEDFDTRGEDQFPTDDAPPSLFRPNRDQRDASGE